MVCDPSREPAHLRRSISVPSELPPTAKQLLVLMHDTPCSALLVAPVGLALRTIAQRVPFRRSTNMVLPYQGRAVRLASATAKQVVGLVQDTRDTALPTP